MSAPTPALRQALEAILFLASEPVAVERLGDALEVDADTVRAMLAELDDELTRTPRGFVLRNVAGGWRFYSHPDAAPWVEQWVLEGRSGRLTPAALETLAVIAYKQPISRSEIGEVRGVSVDGAVRSLVQRGFVREVGRSEGPGQPVLYGTTGLFLEQLGLEGLDDLPPLTEYLTESAPDEPRTDDLRTARRRLASGEDLPATGADTWDPTGRAAALVAAVAAVARQLDPEDVAAREAHREQRASLAGMGEELDRATDAAMARVDAALAAVARAESLDDDEDAP